MDRRAIELERVYMRNLGRVEEVNGRKLRLVLVHKSDIPGESQFKVEGVTNDDHR